MQTVAPDFKRARFAEWLWSERHRYYLLVRECAELVDGRWEPFIAIEDKSIDLFGRVTHEVMVNCWPTPNAMRDEPAIAERMNNVPKFVLSRTLSKSSWDNTQFLNGDIASEVRKVKRLPASASPSWAAAPSSRNSRVSVSSMNMN
jgi:hypothetical protein